jgi:hypothetical protein
MGPFLDEAPTSVQKPILIMALMKITAATAVNILILWSTQLTFFLF